MTFAQTVREELIGIPVKHPCCRRALLCGLLINAEKEEDKSITLRLSSRELADFASELILLQFARETERKTVGSCGRFWEELRFSTPTASKLFEKTHVPGANPEEFPSFPCEGCRAALLRGLFLSCATVSDPHKSFHLEFTVKTEAGADFVAAFLTDLGYEPKRIARAGGTGLYFKGSGSVEELIVLAGSHHVIFDVINSRIERDIRNNENRATNCVARNIQKTVSASAKQVEAIEKLRASGHMDRLPPELRETARIRFDHPDASLDALSEMHEPPITKSGLNHRLRKILEAAEDTLAGKEKA